MITLLGSDDRWKPENLERQVSFLARHPEVNLVFTDVTIAGAEKPIPSLIDLMKVFPKLIHEKRQGDEFVLSSNSALVCCRRPDKARGPGARGQGDRVGCTAHCCGVDDHPLMRLRRILASSLVSSRTQGRRLLAVV